MKQFVPTLEKISLQRDAMIELVRDWSSINSGTNNSAGLKQMISVLENSFKVLGGKITRIDLPSRKKISPQGQLIEIPTGQALSITKRTKDQQRQLFFGGHMDTVFDALHPFQQVERIDNDTLRGPGVTDMKGGLVVMLKALEALESSPFAGKLGWEILINPDEEVGSVASAPLLFERAKHNHLGLIFEPAFSDGKFVSGRKGSASYTLVVKGKSAHAGRDYFSGKNAIHALAKMIQRLSQYNDQEKGTILNVGNVSGGEAVNVVPDLAICRFNLRTTTEADLQRVETEIKQLIQAEREQGVDLTLYTDSRRGPKPFDTKTEALFNQFKDCSKELKMDIGWRDSGGVCDGNILAEAGLTTIDTLGVVGGNIHTSEEYLRLSSLVERTQLTALFLMRLAEGV